MRTGLLTSLQCLNVYTRFFQKNSDPGSMDKMYTRQGYLFLMEKSELLLFIAMVTLFYYIFYHDCR